MIKYESARTENEVGLKIRNIYYPKTDEEMEKKDLKSRIKRKRRSKMLKPQKNVKICEK